MSHKIGRFFFSNLFGLLRIYEHLDNTWRQTRRNRFCRLVTRRNNFNEVSSMLRICSLDQRPNPESNVLFISLEG